MGNSSATAINASGITNCLKFDQIKIFYALQSSLTTRPEELDEPYPRSLYVVSIKNGYVTHQGGYITLNSLLIEELSQ